MFGDCFFFFSSRRRHTRCALVTGVQTCALPILQAIDAREAEGQKLENRLIRIEKMQIAGASVNGSIASITLRFEADIAAVTRDREGNVIAGSMTDRSEERRVGKECVSTCRSRG